MKKTIFLLLTTILILINYSGAQYKAVCTYDWDGRPDCVMPRAEVVSTIFVNNLQSTLPEGRSVAIYNPQLLDTGKVANINITCGADVWITFVFKSCWFRNSLGYYTYNTNNPPTTPPADSSITMIFPNAADYGDGGSLNLGDKVYLGNFPPNTSIGFVLVSNGWQASGQTTGNYNLYSNPAFNPEPADSLKRHTVLLKDTVSGRLIVGFEDTRRDWGSDNDFNDVVFIPTIQAATCVGNFDSIAPMITDGEQSNSGQTGGLESFSLGNAIAKRVLGKAKNNMGLINYEKCEKFIQNNHSTSLIGHKTTMGTSNVFDISALMPTVLVDSGYIAYTSSPKDLTTMTNALAVKSVDYTKNNVCKAVAFLTLTNNSVYDHTKSVCDRVKGGTLLSIEDFSLYGYHFVRYAIRQATGNIEYATNFSISTQTGRNTFGIQSKWLVKDYIGEETMYNYQLWASAPYLVTDMMIDILNKLKSIAPITQLGNNTTNLPTAYITSGKRVADSLYLTIKNSNPQTSGYVSLAETPNENATNTITQQYPFQGNGNGTFSLTIPFYDNFEANLSLYAGGQLEDLAFLSDGAWIAEFDSTKTSLNNFTITNDAQANYTDEFPLYRDMHISAVSSDFISVAKLLQGGGAPADLSGYKYLRFTAKGGYKLRVTFVKSSISNWNEQYYTELYLSPNQSDYLLDMTNANVFKSINGKPLVANDVTTVLFSYEFDGVSTSLDASLSKVAFINDKQPSSTTTANNNITIYPNPVVNGFTCSYYAAQQENTTLNIVELASGRKVYSQTLHPVVGLNKVFIPTTTIVNRSTGYLVTIEGLNNGYKCNKLMFAQ